MLSVATGRLLWEVAGSRINKGLWVVLIVTSHLLEQALFSKLLLAATTEVGPDWHCILT